MVMAGGAVATRLHSEIAERLARIGAHLLQVGPDTVQRRERPGSGPRRQFRSAEVARTWYLRPQDLPYDVHAGGLEATAGYKTRARFRHVQLCRTRGARVSRHRDRRHRDPRLRRSLRMAAKLVNPMVVDGQIYGGTAQGIGTALYEEMPFDAAGQPLASTLSDYILPGPTEVPAARIVHMETLSPYTVFGQKGIGEGGAIAPPAAIANAVNDALRGARDRDQPVADHAAPRARGRFAPTLASARQLRPRRRYEGRCLRLRTSL